MPGETCLRPCWSEWNRLTCSLLLNPPFLWICSRLTGCVRERYLGSEAYPFPVISQCLFCLSFSGQLTPKVVLVPLFLSILSTGTNIWKVLEEFLSIYRQFSSIVDLLGTPVNWDRPWFFWVLAALYLVWELFQKQKNLNFLKSFLQEYFNILQEIQSVLLKQVTGPVYQGKKGKKCLNR